MKSMRFECDSCQAKYKISDDKVRGRVVRFPCRKCDHRILIDGRNVADVTVPAGTAYGFEDVTRRSGPAFGPDAPTARARRPSQPGRRRPPSVPPRRPVAASRRLSSAPAVASAALVGQHPGLAPPVPAALVEAPVPATREIPQWHVSINDVPIGPIKLEEMAHKVDAGAVSEYSLVWREGFDEWRPLATVPELMSLLHDRRNSGPPPRSSFSSMPAFVESRTSVDRPPASPPSVPAAAVRPELPGDFAPLADSLQPEPGVLGQMSQPPAPIGPSEVFEASPQVGSFSGLPSASEERVSVPAMPPGTAAAPSTERRRSRLSVGVLALMLSLVVFSAVFAFLVFERYGDALMSSLLGDSQPAAAPAPAPVPAEANPAPPVETPEAEPVEADAPTEGAEHDATDAAGDATAVDETETAEATANEKTSTAVQQAALVVEPPNPADDGPKIAPAPPRRLRARRVRSKPDEATEGDGLSAADQKLLDDFGSSADATPAKIDVEESAAAKSKKPPLDGDAVRATVTTNKPRLQRCYERSIRGQQSPPSVRMDVTVTVASSGRVKNASAVGSGPGGLAECIEASVRRWRFPSSSEGGPAKFPIVFSAN